MMFFIIPGNIRLFHPEAKDQVSTTEPTGTLKSLAVFHRYSVNGAMLVQPGVGSLEKPSALALNKIIVIRAGPLLQHRARPYKIKPGQKCTQPRHKQNTEPRFSGVKVRMHFQPDIAFASTLVESHFSRYSHGNCLTGVL